MTTPVDLEKFLAEEWIHLEAQGKMRSCLFNLIVYSKIGPREPYLRKIIQNVMERFPCRLLFVSLDPHASCYQMKASVLQSSPSMLCDSIEITLPPSQKSLIYALILPHLISDLPIYLLWGDDLKEPLDPNLLSIVDRFIVDSENATTSFFSTLSNLARTVEVSDLNWARTENWRELLASFFSSKERRDYLKTISTITIQYNSFETPFFSRTKIESLYLQAWIAKRLQWNFSQCTNSSFVYEGRTVLLNKTENKNLPPGAPCSILVATKNGQSFLFDTNREIPNQITMTTTTPLECAVPSHHLFSKNKAGFSLVREICHGGSSSHFLEALDGIKQYEEEIL